MPRLLTHPRLGPATDVLVATWVVLWVVLGFAIAAEVRGPRELSVTVTRVGVAVQQTGDALKSISSVPLIGDRVGAAVTDIDAAGASAVRSGRSSRESIRSLAWMLGLFVAVMPALPLLLLYLPARVGARRGAPPGPEPTP